MSINLSVQGNTQPLEAAVQAAVNRIRKTPIKITVDDKGATQPLGNMKRGADEFSKSMEAANSRIIAFGASMAIINGVADGFKALVKNVVEVEKALADINVVMNLSTANLEKFSNGLFKTAKETGAAFNVAAEAATEYARQGLTMEESLKRTRDALILTRLTGMDSANAVKALTAAMNTYGDQIKDTTQLVSKFAAVDVKFAVSAEDFADAISRTGQAAKSAGVDIDELVGLVTAAQQQTARGGKVIGNSFKTIFTRIGRSDTLNQLENLGIAVRDLEGNTIGARRILTDLANTFDHLTESQKAQIAQTVGGVFQINILKAVLSDAAKQNGILANATQISAGATTEAIDKNDQLRQTMSAMATETGLALKELSAQIGEIMLAPGMEKVLNVFKGLAEGANEMLGGGESTGSDFAQGFLKGLGNIITGPGLVIISAVFIKLFAKALVYANQSLKSLIGVTSEAHKQKAIQTSLVTLFGQNAAISKEMLRTDISRTEKERIILGLLKAQVIEANMLNSVSKSVAGGLYARGYNANLAPRKGRAGGHIPNFADPEREQAARGGYAAGTIRSMNMPGEGSVIYNSAEKVKNFKGMSQPAIMPPHSSKAGKNYQQAFGDVHGFDPYAAGGYVPNYARTYNRKSTGNKRTTSNTSDIKKINLNNLFPETSQMGVLLGFGPGDSAGPKEYKQKYSSLSAPAKIALNKKLKPSLVKQLSKKGAYSPLVSATLKTKPVYEVSDGDASQIEQILGKSTLEKKLYKHVGQGFDRFSHEVGVDMFGGKIGKAGTGVLKTHMDGSMLGGILEAAVRGSLSNKKVSDSQAPFDFIGEDAKNVAKFIGDDKLRYIEAKLHKSAAAGSSGKLPMKILNEFKAYGHIPNFADPLSDAIGREKAAGVPVSQIRVGSHPALMGKSNPIGLGVTNTHDEPNGLRDVIGAANGYVPNYFNPIEKAKTAIGESGFGKNWKKATTERTNAIKRETDRIKSRTKAIETHRQELTTLTQGTREHAAVERKIRDTTKNLNKATQKKTALLNSPAPGVGGKMGRFSQALGNSFSGNKGMMMMMGAPMAAGFLQSGGMGAEGGNQGMYAAGGVLNGAASGAMMASMIAPMFGPAAPLVIGIGGLVGGIKGWTDANEANTKALQAKTQQEIKNQTQSASNAISQIIQGEELNQTLSSAGITEQAVKNLGLTGDSSVIDGIKGSTKKIELPESLEKLAKIFKTNKSYVDEAAIAKQVKASTKRYPVNYDLLSKPENELTKGERKNTILMTLRKSYQYQKQSKDFMGMSQDQDAPMSEQLFEKRDRMRQSQKDSRGEIIDYLMENEKRSSFAYDFGEKKGGTGYLDKVQYANLLKGKEVDVGGKIGKQILSEEAIKAALNKQSERIQSEYNNKKAAQVEALILQLDIQKAMITAQQAAYGAQVDIKSKYLEQSNLLNSQEKILGGLISEEQKVRIQYNKSLLKASQAYELGAQAAVDAKKAGILSDIGKDRNLKQALKQELFKDEIGKGKQYASVGQVKTVDLTNKLAAMDAKELLIILDNLNIKGDAANKIIENRNLLYDNSLDKLKRQQTLSDDQSEAQKNLNSKIAKQKDLMVDVNREMQAYIRGLDNAAQSRAIASEITAARFGARPQTQDATFAEQGRLVKERQQGIRESYTKSAVSEMQKLATDKGLTKEQRLEIAADPSKLKGMSSAAIDSMSKEFEDKGGENYINELLFKKPQGEELQALQELKDLQQSITDAKAQTSKQEDDIIEKLQEQLFATKERIEKEKKLQKIREDEYRRKTGPGAFGEGARDAKIDIAKNAAMMEYTLGDELTHQFRDGLVDGMQAAINKADDLSDVMNNIAMNFLGAIQKAYLGKAADAIVGALPFSSGGGVRKYSKGGGVPAMVTNGEYVMGRDAVKKYGGGFMHRLNAGGKLPGYSNGGKPDEAQPGSALAANFGGGEGYNTGRRYQTQAMSGFFYSGQSGNLGLQEDTQYTKGIIQERMRKEAEKKAKKRALMQMIVGTALSVGIGSLASAAIEGGGLTADARADGYTNDTPAGVRSATNSFGEQVSLRRGVDATGYDNVQNTRSFNPFKVFGKGSSLNDRQFGSNSYDYGSLLAEDFSSEYRTSYRGGKINGYANGGHIAGKSGIDQIPAMLSEGEYVIRASSARQLGRPMLDRINAGKFNDGGAVTPLTESSETGTSGGNTNNINITVNMDKGSGKSEKKNDEGGANPKDSSADQEKSSQLAEKVKQQVISVIMDEKRPGGLLSD